MGTSSFADGATFSTPMAVEIEVGGAVLVEIGERGLRGVLVAGGGVIWTLRGNAGFGVLVSENCSPATPAWGLPTE